MEIQPQGKGFKTNDDDLTCKREFQSAKNEDLHWKMEIEILKI